ncbi:hypothetical protein Dsin_021376 [Dipteronia sinensis]|uniref:Bulb-type lectin domain-containing protein n=1 Tax=Dipteronia sinensis TaxID=43782 RepID=A0AAE0A117_9ROSI|nr:hypothetical protein Dsin_021376 [Dipteronia sinensis]
MVNKSTSIYKIFWFISCCLWASPVAAVDVLNQGDVLNSSASLVSRNKLFTLRFFNLSSNYSYLGIFYTSDTNPGKPFWIANRDKPITDNSGALVINETGKLMITFNGGKALLELFSGQLNNKVSAILQDDGNFVLKSGEQILWQSFDFPTDSFLPGMKLGINYTNQSCRSRGESFQQEKGYYPDSVNSLHYDYGNVSLSDCKDICWKNCTCVGTDVTSLNPNGTGCKFWYGPLNQEHFNGSWYYIIRPAPPAPPVEWWKWAVIAVAATIVIAIILVILFLFFMRWRRARFEEKFLLELMKEAKELEIEGRKCFRLKVYSVSSIMDATNCFSHENKLGEGGYGPVYKGLLDGQEIAIKTVIKKFETRACRVQE